MRECRRRENELHHTKDPREAAAVAKNNLAWLEIQQTHENVKLQGKLADFREQLGRWQGEVAENEAEHELDDQIQEGKRYRAGKWAFPMIEVFWASLLAIAFINAPRPIAVLIGVGVTILLGLMCAPAASAWIRRNVDTKPGIQKQRLHRGMIIAGLLCLAANVVAFIIIRSQWDGNVLFLLCTSSIMGLSALGSGLCAAGVDLLFWSRRLTSDIEDRRVLLAALDHLREVSQVRITPVLIVLALLFGSSGIARAASLHIYVDVSTSVRLGETRQVLKNLTERLGGYRGETPIEVTLTPFFDKPYTATPAVKITLAGTGATGCPAAPTELDLIVTTRNKERLQRCEETQAAARAADVSKLNAAIDLLSGLKLTGNCTAVFAAIRRAANEGLSGTSVVVSDMQNDCRSPGLPDNLKADNDVFLVPVSSHSRPIEEAFNSIQASFASVRWVRVIEPYRLDLVVQSVTRQGKHADHAER